MPNLTKNNIDLTEFLDGEVYENYSGRNMFGKFCIGFQYETEKEAIADMMCAIADADEEAHDLYSVLKNYEIDNLGRGVILYFPKLATKL